MGGTKIQINSLEALERLLGGDTELEFELRHSVAVAFARKYLGSAIDTNLKSMLENEIRGEIRKTYFREYPYQAHVKDSFKEEITKAVALEVLGATRTAVAELLAEKPKLISDAEEKIKNTMQVLINRINTAADKVEAELTDAALDKRINDLADKKIKERLGVK